MTEDSMDERECRMCKVEFMTDNPYQQYCFKCFNKRMGAKK